MARGEVRRKVRHLAETCAQSRRLGLAAALVLTACSSNEASTPSTMDAGTTIAPDDVTLLFETATRDAIPIADRGTLLIGDAACATAVSATRRVPVNLLLLLDRSESMGEGTPSRWSGAVAGIRGLLAELDDDTRVGLTMFSSPAGATITTATYATPNVPVAPLRESRSVILGALDGARPIGGTPMLCAALGTRNYYRSFTLDGSRNVVLITDGRPTGECVTSLSCPNAFDFACRDQRGVIAANEVRASFLGSIRDPSPLKYFVAGTAAADNHYLSDLAFSGNTRRYLACQPAYDCHYSLGETTFAADLVNALGDIRGRTASCEFEVDADPSRVDPARVNVSISGADGFVPRDTTHADGWDYSTGMRSVVLYGATCTRVLANSTALVRIVFGCPTRTPG